MANTESWLKANNRKIRDKAITKTDWDGLVVRVSPKGKITYSLRYYYNNKQTRMDLGSYPLLSIKEARSEMPRLRKKLEQGHTAPVALPYNIMQYLRRHEEYELTHFSMHDLRRAARTNFSTLTDPHIAELMLGHSLGGIVWRTYDKHDYLKEQAEAYEAWCNRLFDLVGFDGYAPANDNLIEFGKKRYG